MTGKKLVKVWGSLPTGGDLLPSKGESVITLRELLSDQEYRKFFLAVPKVPHSFEHPRWWVYIQSSSGGPWMRGAFNRYGDAFRYLRANLRDIHDGAIHSRGFSFDPPTRYAKLMRHGQPIKVMGSDGKVHHKTKLVVWKPKLYPEDEPHTWCIYCRRPVVLRWFTKHHADREKLFDSSLKRCPICGCSERLLVRR